MRRWPSCRRPGLEIVGTVSGSFARPVPGRAGQHVTYHAV